MGDRRRIARLLRRKLRSAGRQWAEARREYETGKATGRVDLPRDDEDRARIVCRRHAERRAVALDGDLRPECFDPDHQDCRGCAEDVRDERVETW